MRDDEPMGPGMVSRAVFHDRLRKSLAASENLIAELEVELASGKLSPKLRSLVESRIAGERDNAYRSRLALGGKP